MARKVVKPEKPAEPGADDLQVLHPDISLKIAGRELVVREYGFVEGLKLRPRVQPLLDDLYVLLEQQQKLDLEQIVVILGKYADLVMELVAIAADVELEFLLNPKLTQNEGQALLMAWWAANGPFYLRALVDRKHAEVAAEEARRRAGAMSMQPSPPRDTEPQQPSVG